VAIHPRLIRIRLANFLEKENREKENLGKQYHTWTFRTRVAKGNPTSSLRRRHFAGPPYLAKRRYYAVNSK
jgi:hypothetical protein